MRQHAPCTQVAGDGDWGQAVRALPARQQQAVAYHYVAGLPYAEIAGILEKDEVAVRQMVSRSRKRINSFLRGRCTIYNPRGDCRCRIKKAVDEVDLAAEYEKIGDMVRRVNFYKKSETILPSKNYWENLL